MSANEELNSQVDEPSVMASDSASGEASEQVPSEDSVLGSTLLRMQATLQTLVAEMAVLKSTSHNQPESLIVESPLVSNVTPSPVTVTCTEVREPLNFNFTGFDPNNSTYPAHEWLEEVNKIRIKYKVDDCLAIIKAGQALRGEGRRFYDGWAPLSRTWASFQDDFLTAFPDHESWANKFKRAFEVNCSQFETFSEYARIKVRDLYRFHSDLPWEKVLSIVIEGINSNFIFESVRIQSPSNLSELILILRKHEATKRKISTDRKSDSNVQPFKRRRQDSTFSGKCFNCGKTGHKKEDCRYLQSGNKFNKNLKATPSECTFCKRVGHSENDCWKKNGKPKAL